jgi:hypothetical protein
MVEDPKRHGNPDLSWLPPGCCATTGSGQCVTGGRPRDDWFPRLLPLLPSLRLLPLPGADLGSFRVAAEGIPRFKLFFRPVFGAPLALIT